MFNSLTRQRVQWIVTLSALALVAYYFLVYWPLSNTVVFLDKPLTNLWQQLVLTNGNGRSVDALDLAATSENLRQSQLARRTLAQQREQVLSRIALDPEIEKKLRQPFQYIDFQNERQARIEELSGLAKKQQVALDPSVVGEYPRYTAEQEYPSALWAELAIFHHALATALHSKIKSIQSAKMLPMEIHRSEPAGSFEFRVALELIGPMSAASRFLLAVPLRGIELKDLGLQEVLAAKPVLFIDKMILRKSSADRPDEVQVNVVVSGFSFAPELADEAHGDGARLPDASFPYPAGALAAFKAPPFLP